MRYERFKVDRKLDNRREPIEATMVNLSFKYDDSEIKVRRKRYVARSGYCLDQPRDKGLSLSIDDIDEVQHWCGDGESWEIETYLDTVAAARDKLIAAVRMRKAQLQREVDRLKIPKRTRW